MPTMNVAIMAVVKIHTVVIQAVSAIMRAALSRWARNDPPPTAVVA